MYYEENKETIAKRRKEKYQETQIKKKQEKIQEGDNCIPACKNITEEKESSKINENSQDLNREHDEEEDYDIINVEDYLNDLY